MAPTPDAEALFADWLERTERGERVDLEGLCREHPDQAEALRSLERRWRRLSRALEEEQLWPTPSGAPASSAGEGAGGERGEDELALVADADGGEPRYRVEGELGRGGMGTVLRVLDERLGRRLALKVAGRGGDQRRRARFLEEAHVTGRLQHPGVVPVHDLGVDGEGRPYFTMKLVEGRTLQELFDERARGEGDWTLARLLRVLLRACESLGYAHAQGIIHRDLKPSNVMVGHFGEVYVMDWGLAKALHGGEGVDVRPRPPEEHGHVDESDAGSGAAPGDTPLLTMDGDVLGTPAYMPPEQARGELAAMGPASDVYAVGAMLYHLLTGRMPYAARGERPTSREVWRRVCAGPPRPLAEAAPDAPTELVALCEKAMQRDPARRYPDVSALAADLAAYLEGRVVSAYEQGAWAEARKWVRRNRGLALALAGVLVALVAGAAAFATAAARAERKADETLRLATLQDVQELLDRARGDDLWPAHPERIPAFEAWIAEARALVATLPEFRGRLEALRADALPRTDAEVERERASHPDAERFEDLRAELTARRRALENRRRGPGAPAPDGALHPDRVPTDPGQINRQAWFRVRPDRRHFGMEAEGLAYARLLLERHPEHEERAEYEDTLAWAWFALGHDDEALAASERSVAHAAEDRVARFAGLHEQLVAAVEAFREPGALDAEERALEELAAELRDVDAELEERRAWTYPPELDTGAWWDTQLAELVAGLEELERFLEPEGVVPQHGWTVPQRLAFARDLEEGFAPGGAHAAAWDAARDELRAAYPGLDLKPQLGLVPIGPDPRSHLWEFAHLRTGTPPERDAEGELVLGEDMGVVLVLVPGGTFWMGAQGDDPAWHNYDRYTVPNATGLLVHEVRLSPYFISKYELTVGQWQRLRGDNPSLMSRRSPGPVGLHPLERTSWNENRRWLLRAGLDLPTEAQWEHAARGGTETAWFTGPDVESLVAARVANLWDEDAIAVAEVRRQGAEPLPSDGFAWNAVVGSFEPNPFGLHDVYGNVEEDCRDGFGKWYYRVSPYLDPVGPGESKFSGVVRGGHLFSLFDRASSASRRDRNPENHSAQVGVRPGRDLTP